ncbi:hypothetical protein KIW84_064759 [Lathyrus oleraceus]|uniref:Uncharacterized protein n=1 Tax=Pisum sativum TaxID=3888 RepID=A0A9D5A981_PEA|nr:hypothetical protein KIW84_064753 [Pisum sativum]KAI5399546.1 hypothetical protein KIW84_064759 [Pisum sativum]
MRGVPLASGIFSCSLCFFQTESTSQIFVTCEMTSSVWYRIFRWLGRYTVFHEHILTLFQMFRPSYGVLRIRGRLTMVCHAVVWSIWKSHNDIFFSGSLKTKK